MKTPTTILCPSCGTQPAKRFDTVDWSGKEFSYLECGECGVYTEEVAALPEITTSHTIEITLKFKAGNVEEGIQKAEDHIKKALDSLGADLGYGAPLLSDVYWLDGEVLPEEEVDV